MIFPELLNVLALVFILLAMREAIKLWRLLR